jgi:hypothetical protein
LELRPNADACADSTAEDTPNQGGAMEVAFWATVAIVFVVAVLATLAFGTFKMFGGGHRPQH